MTLVPGIKEIHVEPTTVCQAECPMCPRTMLGYHLRNHSDHELTLSKFKEHVDPLVHGLHKVLFCGTLGEPTAAKDLLEMIRWLKVKNPTMIIGINTNGGLRSTDWWRELAMVLRDDIRSYVVFSIDGLEDTNHIYRRNVIWSRLIDNATAYIAAGGNAQWDGLIFRHNQHQVPAMRDLAKVMGFRIFRTKVSSRQEIDGISVPDTGRPSIATKEFSCMAENTASLYLSARGLWYPCCYIHHHDSLGGNDWGRPLEHVDKRGEVWSDMESRLHTDARPSICTRSCATSYNSGQWTNEESL